LHSLNKTVGENADAPTRQDLLKDQKGETDGAVMREGMLAAKKRALLRAPTPHALLNAQLTQMGVPKFAISRGAGRNEKAFVDVTKPTLEGVEAFVHHFTPTTWDGIALSLVETVGHNTPDLATRLLDRREALADRLPTRLMATRR